MMHVACEAPTLSGFAEQFRDMAAPGAGLESISGGDESELASDDEVLKSADLAATTDSLMSTFSGNGISSKTWSLEKQVGGRL